MVKSISIVFNSIGGKRKRIKSCPPDTMEAIKDVINWLDEVTVLNELEQVLGVIRHDKTGDKTIAHMEHSGGKFKKILNNPEQREILMKLLDGKDANSSSGGGGGGGYF